MPCPPEVAGRGSCRRTASSSTVPVPAAPGRRAHRSRQRERPGAVPRPMLGREPVVAAFHASSRPSVRIASGLLVGGCLVAAVTGLVFALKPVAPVLGLGVLYLLAVVPAAIVGGLAVALPVSVASMLAYNFFF